MTCDISFSSDPNATFLKPLWCLNMANEKIISEDGLSPAEDKVTAINNARETATEVRSLLGLVDFCVKFIPDSHFGGALALPMS